MKFAPPTRLVRLDHRFADYLRARADDEQISVVELTRRLLVAIAQRKGLWR